MLLPFSKEELENGRKHLKAGKASGLAGITTEMIQHFGSNLVTGSYCCSTVVPRNAIYPRSGDGLKSSLS